MPYNPVFSGHIVNYPSINRQPGITIRNRPLAGQDPRLSPGRTQREFNENIRPYEISLLNPLLKPLLLALFAQNLAKQIILAISKGYDR
jgi:hypothetical protein